MTHEIASALLPKRLSSTPRGAFVSSTSAAANRLGKHTHHALKVLASGAPVEVCASFEVCELSVCVQASMTMLLELAVLKLTCAV